MAPEEPAPAPDQHRRSAVDADPADGGADADIDTDGESDDDPPLPDGGEVETHTIRLELVDEPGQLLAALEPIADNGGNLLSIYHERGNLTPRGHIPVEVDLSCPPARFETIVAALRENGVNVVQAGRERYGETLTVVLTGHIIDTDLSDTIQRVSKCANATVDDIELSAPSGTDQPSSARLRLDTRRGHRESALDSVRAVAEEKGLDVIEPVTEVAP